MQLNTACHYLYKETTHSISKTQQYLCDATQIPQSIVGKVIRTVHYKQTMFIIDAP